jgi:restriction system protein
LGYWTWPVHAVVARAEGQDGGGNGQDDYAGVLGLESVHALTGVMADHNATRGVLVTTSWFGRASEQFANRNRITLVNGAELKQLIKQHLNRDVIPGTSPPRRIGPSDDTQTGRP